MPTSIDLTITRRQARALVKLIFAVITKNGAALSALRGLMRDVRHGEQQIAERNKLTAEDVQSVALMVTLLYEFVGETEDTDPWL